MANSLDAALIVDHLARGLITVASNRLAPLRAFSRDFGTDTLAPRSRVQVRKATTASAAQTNPTNFETGDTTLDNVEVTVNQISKSFHISNAENNQGFKLDHLAEVNANIFANTISDVWTDLLEAAAFPAPAPRVIGTTANFDSTDLPDIYGDAKNFSQKSLILDGAYVGRLIPTTLQSFKVGEAGAFGFDGMFQQNRWTGAVANTVGFCCSPDAIAVASGLPALLPRAEFLDGKTFTIPGLELSVGTYVWFARGSRTLWASFDVMFGAAVGDSTQGLILKSA